MEVLNKIVDSLNGGEILFIFKDKNELYDRHEYRTLVVKGIRQSKKQKRYLVLESPKGEVFEIRLKNLPSNEVLVLKNSPLVEKDPDTGWHFKQAS